MTLEEAIAAFKKDFQPAWPVSSFWNEHLQNVINAVRHEEALERHDGDPTR